jgi:hypothetical protein
MQREVRGKVRVAGGATKKSMMESVFPYHPQGDSILV